MKYPSIDIYYRNQMNFSEEQNSKQGQKRKKKLVWSESSDFNIQTFWRRSNNKCVYIFPHTADLLSWVYYIEYTHIYKYYTYTIALYPAYITLLSIFHYYQHHQPFSFNIRIFSSYFLFFYNDFICSNERNPSVYAWTGAKGFRFSLWPFRSW